MVIYLAGLQDVPTELDESAEIDGASTVVTAAYWRNEGHLISIVQRPGAFAKLLVHRDQQRTAHLRKAGEPRLVLTPEIPDFRAVLELDLLFGHARNLARQPEKKHPDLQAF